VLVLRRSSAAAFGGALGGGYFVAAVAFFRYISTTAVSISITGAVLVCDCWVELAGRLVELVDVCLYW
jgi:hypothetical protein